MGGRQRRRAGALDRVHEPLYGEAVVATLDPGSGSVVARFTHRTPGAPSDAGHCFKGAARDGDSLLLCTERELVWVDPVRWQTVRRLTHPWFNDLHHAMRFEDRLLVASSGLDCVLEVSDGGEVLAVHGALGPITPADTDFRYRSTRPHASHPNHVFVAAGRPWMTRCHQRDAISLTAPQQRIAVDLERVHDGLPIDDQVWFTTVDGHLVETDVATGGPTRIVDLRDGGRARGWCRGLWIARDDAFVGFTRIRATALRSGLAVVEGGLRGDVRTSLRPTRVEQRDRLTGALRGSWRVDQAGIDALFAVLPA